MTNTLKIPGTNAPVPDTASCYGQKFLLATPARESAQDLLEALEEIHRSLNFSTNGGTSRNRFECELFKISAAAIAKAKGEA